MTVAPKLLDEFRRAERMLHRAVKAETELAAARAELAAARVALAVHADVNTPDTLPSMAKPKMVMRSLRVPEKLWEQAKEKADEREENISDVIREALERYVRSKR